MIRDGKTRLAALLLAACLLALQGCTAFKSDDKYRLLHSNVKLVSRLSDHVQPEPVWARAVLFPVILPTGYAFLAVDIAMFLTDDFVLNPVRFFHHGFKTGWNFLWGEPTEGSPYTKILKWTFKALVTPPTIGIACFMHAFFFGDDWGNI